MYIYIYVCIYICIYYILLVSEMSELVSQAIQYK